MRRNYLRSLAAVVLLASAAMTAAVGAPIHTATVLETMDSGGYTYVKVDEEGAVYWAAAPATEVSVGDRVTFTEQMKMVDFTSRTLGRTFEELMFVGGLGGGSAASGAQAAQAATLPDEAAVLVPIAKAQGGYTIAEVFAGKDDLKGKTVRVRGKVVKVSRNIMGLNWVHLQDGSGADGTDRLIFRSATNTVDIGTVVTAEGTLDTDKDFGYAYRYAVLVDDSSFSQ